MSGKIKHLQLWKGNYRVRMGVPADLRQHLPAPHTGRRELVKGLGTANLSLAGRLAAPIIAEFRFVAIVFRVDEDLAQPDPRASFRSANWAKRLAPRPRTSSLKS